MTTPFIDATIAHLTAIYDLPTLKSALEAEQLDYCVALLRNSIQVHGEKEWQVFSDGVLSELTEDSVRVDGGRTLTGYVVTRITVSRKDWGIIRIIGYLKLPHYNL